ncbi:BspA family leucine-rich repeat surface protein [Bifidobacterium sp. ESL0745]|uniref:BspA family leucine-rich repeat surface protein n=1 Tax=Bifidobacterium sp. ESL0745 TaxID=2983226 RepID=UPI0023F96B9E|nr:BspA family leucine-rich repeat surface protein [Bifidobacterium sp. ESL0745]MDF7666199.1 BspA family leucine-rich repeat surface protein [Bifidobacterium sp. ESL0745]
MRKPLKAAMGILAAAAMLSIPALSNADDIQRSHPENTAQSQTQTQAALQAPSTQSLCDPTVKNMGSNVTGQLSNNSDGCKLTITAGAGGGTFDKNTLQPLYNSNAVTEIAFAGSNKIAFPADSSSMFYDMFKLKNIDLGGSVDTSNVTNMKSMFSSCRNLRSLDLSHLDTHNVTNMHQMFLFCWSLRSLDVSHLDTHNVIDMSAMFEECGSLASLDLSHFDTRKVTDMGNLVNNCSKMKSLDLGGTFDTSNVTEMSDVFDNCFNLIQLTVGKNVHLSDDSGNASAYEAEYDPIKWQWVQLEVPGTDSAHVNQSGTTRYIFTELKARTRDVSASDRDGTYVRIGYSTLLILKAESPLPKDTSVAGEDGLYSTDAAVGNNVPVHDANGTVITKIVALGYYTLPDEANSPFTISGCPETGCTFQGWAENADGSGPLHQPGSKIDLTNKKVTLYATWKAEEPKPAETVTPSEPAATPVAPDTTPSGSSSATDSPSSTESNSSPTNNPASSPSPMNPKPGSPSESSNASTSANPSASSKPGTSANPTSPSQAGSSSSNATSPIAKPNISANQPEPSSSSASGNSSATSGSATHSQQTGSATPQLSAGTATQHETATSQNGEPVTGIATEAAPAIPAATSPVAEAAVSPVAAPIVSAVATTVAAQAAGTVNATNNGTNSAAINNSTASGTSPNAVSLQSGRDTNSTPALQPAAPKSANRECAAIAWRTGDIHPAAYQCNAGTPAASVATDTADQTPIWIFLLLMLATLFVFFALSSRSRFEVVRHRAMETEE